VTAEDQTKHTDEVVLVFPDIAPPLPKAAAAELLALLVEEHQRASGTQSLTSEAA
jgi:hypothetical protein